MSNHTYKIIEVVGTSPESIDKAIANGIAQTAKTVRNMRWFEVTDTRGQIVDDGVAHWQVTVKIGFTIED